MITDRNIIFFQGINNYTKKCDINFNYKKCGFLIDLKIDFCIKENEMCPFKDTDTNFYLTNLTSDIILLFEDKNLKIDNIYEISDFLPEIYILNKKKHKILHMKNLILLNYINLLLITISII